MALGADCLDASACFCALFSQLIDHLSPAIRETVHQEKKVKNTSFRPLTFPKLHLYKSATLLLETKNKLK